MQATGRSQTGSEKGTLFAIHIDFVYNALNLGVGRIHWKKYSSLMLGIVGDDEGGGSGLPTIIPDPLLGSIVERALD
jgi:hypothetical protein